MLAKKAPLDRTVPSDEIGFDILSNFMMFIKQIKERPLGDGSDIFDSLMDKALSSDGRYTRRSLERFQQKAHIKLLKERRALVIGQLRLKLSGSLARVVVQSAKSLIIRWRPTERGLMYFCCPRSSKTRFLFCGHFFDRFIERGLGDDDSVTRILAVGKFLWHLLQRDDNRRFIFTETGAFYLFCKEGAALGYQRLITNRDGDRNHQVVFFKTFISREMFSEDQKRLESQAELLAPMDYEEDYAMLG